MASLNYLLSSHVWRQDHNGFSHQDPGFIDHVVNKKAEVIRVYLPPDTNCLLSVADHCLRSRHYVNVIVAGKQPSLNYLSMDDAILHCTRGIGIWDWASNDGGDPDVVMACCGDIPTLETLAAVDILRFELPAAQGPGGKRRRPDAPANPRPSTLTVWPTPSSTPSSPRTGRSFSLTTATHRSSTASLTGAPTTPTSTSAVTRKKARPRRRSTWSCSTIWTGSTW